MTEMTPNETFLITWIVSGLTGAGNYWFTEKNPTFRGAVAALIRYGAAGCVLGAFAYEVLDGKNKPWIVVICGMAVAIKMIRIPDISDWLRRILLNGKNGSAK